MMNSLVLITTQRDASYELRIKNSFASYVSTRVASVPSICDGMYHFEPELIEDIMKQCQMISRPSELFCYANATERFILILTEAVTILTQ